MTQESTILFGVGATKAGTTWLYNHLASHPECHLRSIKELHYFDSIASGNVERQLKLRAAAAERLASAASTDADRAAATAARRADLAQWIGVLERQGEDIPAYLAYLTAGQGGRRLVADITPSYGLLPVDRLRAMAAIGPDVRFVYLMRDPVARLWSHVRMLARRSVAAAADFPAVAHDLLQRILAGAPSGAVARGDYAAAITRLRAAVDPQRLLVMFQEDLMSRPGLARLCGFLGIAVQPAAFGRRVHQGAPLSMTEEQRLGACVFLRSQYEFVARQFSDVPDAWRKNMAEVVG
ncbi:MAG TPA: sulfotransferase [Paracoccaceae bacterium]